MTDAKTQTGAASVRVSVKDGTVEIVGSEDFVRDTLKDTELIRKLIAAAQEEMDSTVDDMKDSLDKAKEDYKAAMTLLADYFERVNQITSRLQG